MPDIHIKNLNVSYKEKHHQIVKALNDISLDLRSDKIHVVLGYSGSGKTTLLKCIAGLLDYEGQILFNNIDALNIQVEDRNLSYVTQESLLFPRKTIYDNIVFPLKVMGVDRNESDRRVKEIASDLDIYQCLSRKPKVLSIGQQQRAALAKALIKDPVICLFDEPLSNVDSKTREEIRLIIKEQIKEHHITAIYVTHDIKEALILADNLIVLNDGKVEISGSPKDVIDSNNEVVETLLKE